MLSTITNKINENTIESSHTTGDSVQINRMLDEMIKQGCTHCFMEVSSHAIDQKRIEGLAFDIIVFTNDLTSSELQTTPKSNSSESIFSPSISHS